MRKALLVEAWVSVYIIQLVISGRRSLLIVPTFDNVNLIATSNDSDSQSTGYQYLRAWISALHACRLKTTGSNAEKCGAVSVAECSSIVLSSTFEYLRLGVYDLCTRVFINEIYTVSNNATSINAICGRHRQWINSLGVPNAATEWEIIPASGLFPSPLCRFLISYWSIWITLICALAKNNDRLCPYNYWSTH